MTKRKEVKGRKKAARMKRKKLLQEIEQEGLEKKMNRKREKEGKSTPD